MSPKPLKPPASFEVFAVWEWSVGEHILDSEWETRCLAEARKQFLNDDDPSREASVHAHTVWRDAEAFRETQS